MRAGPNHHLCGNWKQLLKLSGQRDGPDDKETAGAHEALKEKRMVRWKRGIENVSPADALSPKAHLSCPARCKGRWHWEDENRGFV